MRNLNFWRTGALALALCSGLGLHAQNAPANAAGNVSKADLASNVGELLRLDAAQAVTNEKKKSSTGGDAMDMGSLNGMATMPLKLMTKVEPQPVRLRQLFGINGQRRLALELDSGLVLNFVEDSKLTDANDPRWKLLAIEGRCASFDFVVAEKTARKSKKKSDVIAAEGGKVHVTCYSAQAVQMASMPMPSAVPMPGVGINVPVPQLPMPIGVMPAARAVNTSAQQ